MTMTKTLSYATLPKPAADIWPEWLLEARDDCIAFVPYEEKTRCYVTGLTVIADRCPGKLIGVIHPLGQEAADKWVAEHPDWMTKYAKENSND